MAIFQGDIVIRQMIELGIQDMRDNPYLVDHMLSDLISIPYFAQKYGQKQVDACKSWFKESDIEISMVGIKDREKFPCISIEMGQSNEKEDMKHMGDTSSETMILMPNVIGKTIPYIIKPFTPVAYDISIGLITVPSNFLGLEKISAGMLLVNPINGSGYKIVDVSDIGIFIEAGIEIDDAPQLGVLPQKPFFEARVEHTFFTESYKIGCHSHGDPQIMLWLHSICLYSVLRYRESLLEANGFAQSSVSSAPPSNNGSSGDAAETVWSRYLTITGQVENSWVKSPRRYIESIVLKDTAPAVPEIVSQGFTGGIKIISNLDTDTHVLDPSTQIWTTVSSQNS